MSKPRETGLALAAALLLLVVNSAFVSSSVGFVHKPKHCLETDHYHYIAMATALPGHGSERAREAPFCYRVFVPAVVYLLGFMGVSTNAAFYLVTNFFLLAFLMAFYALLRRGGATVPESVVGVVLVGLAPGAVRWYEYQYWMPDPACLFFLTLAVGWIRAGQERRVLVVSPIAALVRETYLLTLPYAFLHAWRRGSLRSAALATTRLALATLPVLVLLRMVIPASGGVGLVAAAREMVPFRIRHLWENQLYFATLGSFGVLLPLALLNPPGMSGFTRRRPEDVALVALSYASLAFANNTDRLLAYALPAVVPVAVRGLRALEEAAGIGLLPLAASAVALQAFFYWRTPFHEPGISIYQPTNLSVTFLMVVFWLGGIALLRRRGRPRLAGRP
jgi:hypothetical protein